MTTQTAISALAQWLRTEVCPDLRFKVAAKFKLASDVGYQYRLAAPAVYETYFPATAAEHGREDDDRPQVAPAIIVTIAGQSTYSTKSGMVEYPFNLLLQTWNPGTHGVSENGEPTFVESAEGWRDVVNLADTVAGTLAEAECPGGLCLTDDIVTTLPSMEGNEFYPYYRAEVAFTATAARRIAPKFGI